MRFETMIVVVRETLGAEVNVPKGELVQFTSALGAAILGHRRLAKQSQTGILTGTTLALLGCREWNFLKPILFDDTLRAMMRSGRASSSWTSYCSLLQSSPSSIHEPVYRRPSRKDDFLVENATSQNA